MEKERRKMKKKLLVMLLGITMIFSLSLMTACGGGQEAAPEEEAAADPAAECAALIDAIYVQEYTDDTYAQCEAAKKAWDALTDEQKEQVEGEFADPDYFGRDTGDASKDDPLNQDEIGENELLVVSFGTSFNESRAEDIGGIEKALQEANPDWSVRRAFTAQIIINHVYARDGEKIDNVDQALQRAVDNGVKNLVVQPTHLMHGAEYDELITALDNYKDKFDTVKVAEPLLGTVGEDATVINADKEATAKAVVAEAVAVSDYDSLDAAAADGTAFVFMGHGTSHEANITYDQMQEQMKQLGYKNVFIGTVEGNPEDTAFPAVKKAVEDAGYTKVILRPLMVVAGDHANNDMAGDEEGAWYYGMVNGGEFEVEGADKPVDTGAGLGADNVSCQIEGLGRIADIQKIYVAHTAEAMAQ
jgi:cobalamin biosynthesis Co2+ chelatase CbiK